MLFAHGRGATRRVALRVLPTITRLHLPSLDITYRNDLGAPRSSDGLYQLGKTEWLDLQSAAQWAVIGIHFSAFDQVRRAHEFHVPILLFHGTADTTVPIGPSEAFAALPRLVTLVKTAGAGHVESWNVDPRRYDAAVHIFLRSLTCH